MSAAIMTSCSSESTLPLTPPLSASDIDLDENLLFTDIKSQLEDVADSQPSSLRYERKMGDTELSYFLPSRQSGVNDMYLHLGFKAAARVAHRPRVCTAWAILRLRHPLLCARAEMHDYDDVRFVYDAPASAQDAYTDADANLEYRTQPKDELLDSYLNGPRTLSNSRLSYLILSEPGQDPEPLPTPPRTPSPSLSAGSFGPTQDEVFVTEDAPAPAPAEEELRQYDLLICAMHFLGDGMALHQFANDFFGLLGGERTDEELKEMLHAEWRARWANAPEECILPCKLEENLPVAATPFRRAAAKVDFQLSQERLVGGQVFPRRKHPERLTIVPTVAFPEARTKAILQRCKAHGVSISAALFAVCNVAWARMGAKSAKTGAEAPTLMYSALNLRPYFMRRVEERQRRALWDSYWFLAIGYFNVVLPAFLPAERDAHAATFWHRAREAKAQSTRAAKSPLVAARTQEMARERGERARGWAREDDERERGTWVPPAPAAMALDALIPREPVLPARAKASAAALIGLSLLGNLDGTYKHAAFPAAELHTLTTGSRQRNGAMLLFGYTFKGRLWISLGYDCNGFEGDAVDRFWKEALDCVEEFLG